MEIEWPMTAKAAGEAFYDGTIPPETRVVPAKAYDQAIAERDEYREALERIANYRPPDNRWASHRLSRAKSEIARGALSPSPSEEEK